MIPEPVLERPEGPDAVGPVFRRLGPALHAQALAILADAAAAEDVVQEAFVRVWRRRERLADPSRLDGYLFMAVRNLALDRVRSERREAKRVLVAARAPSRPAEAPDVERIDAAVSSLPPEQREVVVLRVHLGLSFPEVATRTGAALGTVHSRWRYAMDRLRERLAKEQDDA